MARKEGTNDLSGAYDAIECPENPMKYYLGNDDSGWGNKTVLLDCECGCSGCWPLLCKIEIQEATVKWSDFEQPHRNKDSKKSFWEYSHFEGFTFSKEQYICALSRIEENI